MQPLAKVGRRLPSCFLPNNTICRGDGKRRGSVLPFNKEYSWLTRSKGMNNSGLESRDISSISPGSEKPGYGLCRICHSTDHVHKLISPCFCKGSLLYVHRQCLEHWLEAKATDICELCHYQYITEKRPMSFREWVRLARGMERRRLVADVCCSLTLTPMTLTSVALLFNSTFHFGAGYPRPVVFYLLVSLASLILILYVYWLSNTLRSHWNTFRMWRMTHFHVKLVVGVCNLDRTQTAPDQLQQYAEDACCRADADAAELGISARGAGLMSDETYCRSPESVLITSETQASRSLASLNMIDNMQEESVGKAINEAISPASGNLALGNSLEQQSRSDLLDAMNGSDQQFRKFTELAKEKADAQTDLERTLEQLECLACSNQHCNPLHEDSSSTNRGRTSPPCKFCHAAGCKPWEVKGVAVKSPGDGGRLSWDTVICCGRHQQTCYNVQQMHSAPSMSKFSFHALDRPKLSIVRSSEKGGLNNRSFAGLREERSRCRFGTADLVSDENHKTCSVTSVLANDEVKAAASGTSANELQDGSVRVIDFGINDDPETDEVPPTRVNELAKTGKGTDSIV